MSEFPDFKRLVRRVTFYRTCQGVTLFKYFVQERNTRSSLQTERDTDGPLLLPVVFAGNRKNRLHMSCPNAEKWPMSALVDGPPCP
ncbi:hypothetical protein PoB_005861400 [Plakobranchus ocellatus]|uniref:Uncharacterized protein n=1 Tax=Plakobranchus ocellatus TaxID=259542 RepID=A0AAV4CLF0_9GAST|nr:hypothetical protein PoB_005861400 [Plakobranchus ocellatus]